MTPYSSVAMLEKLALLKIALCSAPVVSSASWRRTSVMPSAVPAAEVRAGEPGVVFVLTAAVRWARLPAGRALLTFVLCAFRVRGLGSWLIRLVTGGPSGVGGALGCHAPTAKSRDNRDRDVRRSRFCS